MNLKIDKTINDLFSLIEQNGSEKYSEGITQLAHMCQVGELAQGEQEGGEFIIAAFLYNIGFFIDNSSLINNIGKFGMWDNETAGSEYLRSIGFSNKVASLVESNINAKRYLAYKKFSYMATLSKNNKSMVENYGGAMSKVEADEFERNHYFSLFIKLQLISNRAGTAELTSPLTNINAYKQLCRLHLLEQMDKKKKEKRLLAVA